jgi:hypothetical protein
VVAVVLVGGVPLVAQALTEEPAPEPARAAAESRVGAGPVFGARAPRPASVIPDLGADLAAPTAPVVEIAPVPAPVVEIAPLPAPVPDLAPPGPSVGQWAALRQCESGGDYSITSRSGKYRGAYQFDRSTWNSVAERHAPALVGVDPAHASPADQDALALALYSERGARPWPHCGRHLG